MKVKTKALLPLVAALALGGCYDRYHLRPERVYQALALPPPRVMALADSAQTDLVASDDTLLVQTRNGDTLEVGLSTAQLTPTHLVDKTTAVELPRSSIALFKVKRFNTAETLTLVLTLTAMVTIVSLGVGLATHMTSFVPSQPMILPE